MRRFAFLGLVALVVLLLWGCSSTFPTQADIESELEQTLESVAGRWTATGTDSDVRVEFVLTQSGSAVRGSGTLREAPQLPSIPIVIMGTFLRPTLALDLGTFVFAGDTVTGSLTGEYVSVAGIFTTIQLSGGAGAPIPVLLQETSG